jgi:chemosensory pili system protein ChpA (sensor histidine kinase/response regulator)
VLLVDADADSREMYAFFFEKSGIRVRQASSSADALAALEEALPDVIVTDIPLNRAEGLRLLVELNADPRIRAVPIVVVSGWADQRTPLLASAVGASAFILKPCSPDQLLSVVYGVLGNPGATGQGEPA